MPKYHNQRTVYMGYSFASKLEARVFDMLKNLESAGEITDIVVQDSIYLTRARILYIVDFRITNLKTGEVEWIEAKGVETPSWRIKRKLWFHYGAGTLHVYKAKGTGIRLHETLNKISTGD